MTFECDNFKNLDRVVLCYDDGTCDVIEDIKHTSAQISTICDFLDSIHNIKKINMHLKLSGTLNTSQDKNDPYVKIAFLEEELKNTQNVSFMAAMCAVLVRIQRGYTIEQLREYIENEQKDYRKWFTRGKE